ncbi:SRPBCC family protein [Nordella sp. HKS 07]|uniref:SRPBCC family protein n=1 Tax=Nordella sp. HKS 07 TaxID=2712222 RepID=UPI0013E154B7|nr:SRPBCC family protein [Nordella sp. HKS 07]QIG48301.1 SRPBCC family protein [Nordella sp. HKS 07]
MTPKNYSPGPLAEVSRELGDGEATLVFIRRLRHPPAKVWRALIEPGEQLEWMPFVASRALDRVGPFSLRMTDQENGPESVAEVTVVESQRCLAFQWGADLLTWELEPDGDGTRLTLRHRTKTPDMISSFAAGWHICLDVLALYLDGRPVGRIVGKDALDHGWPALNDAYRRVFAGQ